MRATTKDLFNLRPEVILEIPSRLSKEYGLSPRFVDEEVGKYLLQTVGREALERRYAVSKTPKVLVSKMSHYSWPKGAGRRALVFHHIRHLSIRCSCLGYR